MSESKTAKAEVEEVDTRSVDEILASLKERQEEQAERLSQLKKDSSRPIVSVVWPKETLNPTERRAFYDRVGAKLDAIIGK